LAAGFENRLNVFVKRDRSIGGEGQP